MSNLELSNDWRECRLGDIIDVIGGGTPKTSVTEYWNGDIPWLSVVDFNSDKKYVYDTEKKITKLGLEKSSTKILNKGDIIISARGTVGALGVLDKPMSFNQSCYGIRANQCSFNDYIYLLLKNAINELKQVSYGAVFNTITRNTFDEIEINLPPLPEQKAIAEVLSSLDDKIDLLHKQNQTLEDLAQTLFREWFIEKADDSWCQLPLYDLGTIICGKTPLKNNISYYDGSVPFIKIPDMHNKVYVDTTADSLTTLGSNSQIKKLLPPKSICVSCIATVGLVSMNIRESQTNQQINSIIPNEDIFRNFMFLYMKNSYDLLQSMASGGTATLNLNTGDFSRMEILVPTKDLLIKFDNMIAPIFDKIEQNQKQIKNLEQTRDILLPKLMSGELRVAYD